MTKFLTGNEWYWRMARTIVEGILGVIVAYIDTIIGVTAIPDELKPAAVAIVMAILSPIIAKIGEHAEAVEARKAAIKE